MAKARLTTITDADLVRMGRLDPITGRRIGTDEMLRNASNARLKQPVLNQPSSVVADKATVIAATAAAQAKRDAAQARIDAAEDEKREANKDNPFRQLLDSGNVSMSKKHRKRFEQLAKEKDEQLATEKVERERIEKLTADPAVIEAKAAASRLVALTDGSEHAQTARNLQATLDSVLDANAYYARSKELYDKLLAETKAKREALEAQTNLTHLESASLDTGIRRIENEIENQTDAGAGESIDT